MLQELEQGEEELQAALAAANMTLRARALEEEQQRELCAQVLSLLALLVEQVTQFTYLRHWCIRC